MIQKQLSVLQNGGKEKPEVKDKPVLFAHLIGWNTPHHPIKASVTNSIGWVWLNYTIIEYDSLGCTVCQTGVFQTEKKF